MTGLGDLAPIEVPLPHIYHSGKKRASQVDPADRPFIAWDGEGANLDGPGKPQSYILFGSSYRDMEPLTKKGHLHFFECLDYIIRVGELNPTAFHIAYSFNYDVVQICRSLPESVYTQLYKTGRIRIKRVTTGDTYLVHYIPSKWFSVTKYGDKYHAKHNPTAKTTVRIYDIFTFFASAFTKAFKKVTGRDSNDVVLAGKKRRDDFADVDLEYVKRYWRVEISELQELAEILRERLYGAGLRIREWHGPGALASFVNRQYGIKKHMAVCPPEVREAARYGYAGGRFEIFQLGRTEGPIYSLDINSAYPYAISQLPSLSSGVWTRVVHPKRIAKFGIYRIRLLPRHGGTFLERAPGPLFHRDKVGNISFPWITEGWYWSPEITNVVRFLPRSQYVIEEGWEYNGWTDGGPPFGFIPTMYATRRKWKADGNASELALKLAMNSLYGKMAQRVGWNEDLRRAPAWHQLEWAGWVTSYCRAMLWDAMQRIPPGALIAVETDGLYTTHHPAAVLGSDYGYAGGASVEGCTHGSCDQIRGSGGSVGEAHYHSSSDLGGWEVEEYDEILYVQSGLAHLRKGDTWSVKRRGLDAKTFELDACRSYLHSLEASIQWKPYKGSARRFIGFGAAIASRETTNDRLGVWVDIPKEIAPGKSGKRVHIHRQCSACSMGVSAYEALHQLSIRSLAYTPGGIVSKPHDIPWEGDIAPTWRSRMAEEEGLIVDG